MRMTGDTEREPSYMNTAPKIKSPAPAMTAVLYVAARAATSTFKILMHMLIVIKNMTMNPTTHAQHNPTYPQWIPTKKADTMIIKDTPLVIIVMFDFPSPFIAGMNNTSNARSGMTRHSILIGVTIADHLEPSSTSTISSASINITI